jgi:hypothetical protein
MFYLVTTSSQFGGSLKLRSWTVIDKGGIRIHALPTAALTQRLRPLDHLTTVNHIDIETWELRWTWIGRVAQTYLHGRFTNFQILQRGW